MTSRDLQAQETRRKLLETSVALIVELGYDAVSVGEICRRCQVAKGTFYVHFASKRDILLSILTDLNGRMAERVAALPVLEPRAAVEARVRIHLETIETEGKDFTRAVLRALLSERVENQGPGRNRMTDAVQEVLTEGQAAGAFRTDRTAAQLAEALESLILGLMTDWCQGTAESFADPAFDAAALVLDGLAPVSPRSHRFPD